MHNDDQHIHAAREKTPIVEISHIEFIFGDERRIVRYCDLLVQVQQVKHPTIRLHINTNITHQKQLYMELYTKVADQPMNQKFVRLIFDPGRHLPNSRSSSFQARENDVDGPQATCVGHEHK